MNNKKIQVWLPLLFSITMAIGMYFGYRMRDNMPGKSFFHTEKRRPIQEIMDLIENKYVDEVKIEQLTDTAIQAMLNKLDPHSVFIPAEQLQLVNDDLAGKFFGIGIEFRIYDDTINVTSVLPDGPGFKAGLEIGDKFLKVNDSSIAGNKTAIDKIVKLLRGNRGTSVKLDIIHNNQLKSLTLKRDAIPIASLDAAYMIEKGTGYIRLNKFSTQTYHEFMEALEGLKKQGLQKLILDLRGNGGGVLEEATEIADEFLAGDKLITYTEGKHIAKKEYRCRRTGQFETGPLVVLADEGTASASEILIGALQDWDRATIIGRRSFGKGLVQEQFDLSDKSAIRLTIARYYTPIGRSIQRSYANGEKAYYDEISNRYLNNEKQTTDSVKTEKSKIFKTKAGKTVFGGGGITPDYFISIDSTGLNEKAGMLFEKGTIGSFAYRYYLQKNSFLKSFKDLADFNTRFIVSDEDWKGFITASAKDSIQLTGISPIQKAALIIQIKSSIARHLWRIEGYFEILNATDDAIKKAKEILAN